MVNIKLAVIPGDGIGIEVIEEAVKLIKHIEENTEGLTFDLEFFPWGTDYYLETGKMMDEDGLEKIKDKDAVLLGAVGDPRVADHITLWDLLLKIRKGFDQYVNVRPVKLLNGVENILKNVSDEDIDMTFIRENTEGEYSGSGSWLYEGEENEVVIQNDVFSRKGTERVMRYAFELARKENKKLTSITKSNAINYSMVFWDQMFNEVSKEYPEVETDSYLVDAAAMHMIKDPKRFEILVTSNLFGDILTDIGASIQGGMGLAAGANINPEGKYPSMFEAIHGSAPDIMGQGLANPLATLWTVSLMFEELGFTDIADNILLAIENTLVAKDYLTADMGGEASTEEVGDAVIREYDKLKNQ